MKGTKVRLFQRINEKYRSYIVGLIAILWITSTFFAYQAMRQPVEIEEKSVLNKIEEKISFDYAAVVQPSTLYPEGGLVAPNKVIFTNLTDKLIIQLEASIHAEKSVKVEGSTRVMYSLIAKDMWEREFKLIEERPISSEATTFQLLHEELQLDLKKILSFIKAIEEETLVRPSNYMLIIKPEIKGNLYQTNNNQELEINYGIEIPFEISGQYIRFSAESPEKELIKTENIEVVKNVPQSFPLLGQELSIIEARYLFGINAVILFMLILVYIVERVMSKEEKITEIHLIDKKHKSKIITVSEKVSFGNSPQLGLKSFKALLQIAEEKEEPILRYADDNDGMVYYYIVGNSTIYYYRSAKNNVIKGSDLAYES